MILSFFKNNKAYHFFFIPLFVLLLWGKSLFLDESYPFFEGEDQMLLYRIMHDFLNMPLVNSLITVGLILFSAFLILYLNTAYDFITLRTFLPSNIYVFIVCGFVFCQTLHPVYFGAVFLLLSSNQLFKAFKEKPDYTNAFNAGFLLGIGTLFYFPLLFYFPIILIGFMLWSTHREWRFPVLAFIGVSLPLFFAFTFYFMTDSTTLFYDIIIQNIITHNLFEYNWPLKVYLGFLIIIILLGSLFAISNEASKTATERKFFYIFFLIFLFSFLLLILVPAVSVEIFIILAIPVAILLSSYLINIRSFLLGDILMAALIGFSIYMQLI